jgi:hypothetical protein
MIAHAFPPEGSAGAYRPLRFARHLPALGWRPSVIAADTPVFERYDPALLQQVAGSIEIERVAARDPWQSIQNRRVQRRMINTASIPATADKLNRSERGRIRSLVRMAVRHAEAWCYHPDMSMGWISPAVEATVRTATRNKADVVWATAGPVSSLIVAERASRRSHIPYVLDFRDAWTITYNEFEAMRPAWARRRDRRMLYRLLSGAKAVVFRYAAEVECYWRAYPGALDVTRVHIIPNGYDGSIDETPIPPRGEKCTVLYGGTLSSYRFDTIIQALQLLKTSDPVGASQLHVRFIGEGTEALANEVAARGLDEIVQASGPTTHDDISREQRNSHALLVLGRPPTMEGHELFAGAKLFGYLKAGRPIVGVLPLDETRRILLRVGVSTVADGSSVPEIVAVFRQVLDAWDRGGLHALVPNREACEAYSAERQTAALARALEGQPAVEPFVPNSVAVPPSLSWSLSTFNSDGHPAFT